MDVDTPATDPVVAADPPADTAAPPAPTAPDTPAAAVDKPSDKPADDTPPRRESRRLRERERSAAPVVVNLPTHPRPTERESPPAQDRRAGGASAPPLHFSTKHYPASAHGEGARRAGHTHFPRLPPDHAPGPLPDGASASFSYRGPPQPPVPGAAPPVPPPPGGTPLVLDRGERPAPPAQDFQYVDGPSQQAVLANMLSQRIDQVDQLRTQLAQAEARIASLSARSNPTAALAQAEARAEAAEARLAAIKDAWRGVENYLDMLSRREAEARAAFVRTLGTGEIGVPPSVPVFGAGPTSPYLPVRPPVPPNVPTRAGPTFPTLPPAPVVGGPSMIWRHESGHPRRRPGPNDTDDSEPPHKRPRSERRRDRDREREREVRKEKARFSDSPSPPPTQKEDKDADLNPPIASLASDDKDADADGDAEEEVDQIVDDVEMTGPNASKEPATRPRRSSDPTAPAPAGARAGSAGAKSDGAVKDVKSKDAKPNGTNGKVEHDENMDAEGSPETDTDELSVDEELLKLTTKTQRRAREYEGYERTSGQYEEYASRGPPRDDYARDEFAREYARGQPNGPGVNGDPRYHPGWYEPGYYEGDQYRDPHRQYAPAPPRDAFSQRNGSGSGPSAPWYAHLKQGSAVATNTQGQRTCRQCGLAGRYKDGKCVEKWGPGPEGPGTVCDRCRKKMKRVERRGTADANMLANGLGPLPLHQHSFHSQTQPQTQSTQPQTQSQLSQTQLGTQYSPQRWAGNGRYEDNGPRGEKRYDLLPSHYGNGADGEDDRRKSAPARKREEPVEAAGGGAKEAPAVEA
ncbi:hypothetical protein RhiJN_15152 [Ceratobasidium sp. AG-Ba]|nr:hypothetical protein RhiJN_15152 [Ceratobasidium sp. AG-Ba]